MVWISPMLPSLPQPLFPSSAAPDALRSPDDRLRRFATSFLSEIHDPVSGVVLGAFADRLPEALFAFIDLLDRSGAPEALDGLGERFRTAFVAFDSAPRSDGRALVASVTEIVLCVEAFMKRLVHFRDPTRDLRKMTFGPAVRAVLGLSDSDYTVFNTQASVGKISDPGLALAAWLRLRRNDEAHGAHSRNDLVDLDRAVLAALGLMLLVAEREPDANLSGDERRRLLALSAADVRHEADSQRRRADRRLAALKYALANKLNSAATSALGAADVGKQVAVLSAQLDEPDGCSPRVLSAALSFRRIADEMLTRLASVGASLVEVDIDRDGIEEVILCIGSDDEFGGTSIQLLAWDGAQYVRTSTYDAPGWIAGLHVLPDGECLHLLVICDYLPHNAVGLAFRNDDLRARRLVLEDEIGSDHAVRLRTDDLGRPRLSAAHLLYDGQQHLAWHEYRREQGRWKEVGCTLGLRWEPIAWPACTPVEAVERLFASAALGCRDGFTRSATAEIATDENWEMLAQRATRTVLLISEFGEPEFLASGVARIRLLDGSRDDEHPEGDGLAGEYDVEQRDGAWLVTAIPREHREF